MNSSGPTLQNPSSSRLGPGQAPNQHSMRYILQFSLCSLDTLERRFCWDIQQTRDFITDRLNNCQSDDTMADSGGYDNTFNYQAGFDEPNATQTFVSPHDRYPMLQRGTSLEVTVSLSEDTELLHDLRNTAYYGPEATLPFPQGNQHIEEPSLEPSPSQFSQDSSLCGTPSFGYGHVENPLWHTYFEEDEQPAAQSQPQYSMYREPPLPILQGGQHVTEPSPSQISQDSSFHGTSSFVYEHAFQSTYLDGQGPLT